MTDLAGKSYAILGKSAGVVIACTFLSNENVYCTDI